MKQKVSVVVLIYQNSHLIDELLSSLSKQVKYINQLVFSSDEILKDSIMSVQSKVAKHISLSSLKPTYVHRGVNLGVVEHVNSLVDRITSEFVLLIGADDYIANNYFEAILPIFTDKKISAVTPNQTRISVENNIISTSKWLLDACLSLNEIISKESFGVPSAGTLHRAVNFKNAEFTKDMLNEDDQILFMAALNGNRVTVESNLFYYRISDSGLSSWLRKPFITEKKFRNNLIREYKNRQQHNKVWLKKYLQYNEQRFDSNTDLLIKRIKKYSLLVEKLNRPGFAFSITLSMRVKILQNLIRFSLKRVIFKILRLSEKIPFFPA